LTFIITHPDSQAVVLKRNGGKGGTGSQRGG